MTGDLLGITAQHVVGEYLDVDHLAPDSDDPNSRRVGERINPLREAPYPAKIGNFTESVDAALIRISDSTSIARPPDGNWARGISHGIDEQPSSSSDPLPVFYSKRRVNGDDVGQLAVFKYGNGSGVLTKGVIDNSGQTTTIRGKDFENNFTIAPLSETNIFATPGDSGAVIAVEASEVNGVSLRAMVVVGILFAGLRDSSKGLACSMPHIISALELESHIPADQFTEDWTQR